MKKSTTSAAVVPAAIIEDAWQEVGASFERFCLTTGLATLADMLEEDATRVCGPRYGRTEGRDGHRWGRTTGKVGFHGGKVEIERPVVSYRVYSGADNMHFQESSVVTTHETYSSGAFSGYADGIMGADNWFSITQEVTITHGEEGQSSSFNAIVKVPEPVTMAIFGFGLLGLGATARRRGNARHRLTVSGRFLHGVAFLSLD